MEEPKQTKKVRKFQNAYQDNGGRIYYSAAPMRRGYYLVSRDYRRKRKARNEMAFKSRRINRHAHRSTGTGKSNIIARTARKPIYFASPQT